MEKEVNIIGIDPGLDGGLVVIMPDGGLDLMVMPTVKIKKGRQIDESRLCSWLASHRPAHVIIELVHSMPKQGVKSTFTFGMGYGIVRGLCAGLGMPYELVTPQAWQKAMLAGNPKGSEYLVASRLWPNIDWRATERCKVAHEGLVDAALIAEFGRRQIN